MLRNSRRTRELGNSVSQEWETGLGLDPSGRPPTPGRIRFPPHVACCSRRAVRIDVINRKFFLLCPVVLLHHRRPLFSEFYRILALPSRFSCLSAALGRLFSAATKLRPAAAAAAAAVAAVAATLTDGRDVTIGQDQIIAAGWRVLRVLAIVVVPKGERKGAYTNRT